MVQVIGQGGQRGPSFGQRLSAGIGNALGMGQQLMQEHQQKEAMRQLGLPENLSPDLQKVALAEMLRSQGKEKLLRQKQQLLQGLFGGQGQPQSGMGQQLAAGEPEQPPMAQGFDPTQIPDEAIAQAAAIDPTLANTLRGLKDTALRDKRAVQKQALLEKKATPEYQREQHIESSQAQADVKYNQQLQEASKQHALKEQSLNRLEKLNEKGVTGKPYEKLLEKFGLVALTSEGRREFAADVKNLITDIRSILGAQFTGFEFQTILNAYPSADFSKAANAAIIKNLKDFQDIKSKEVEFANQIKKENAGKLPFDFQGRVNEKVHEYAQSKLPQIKENTRKIMNEEYGIPEGNVLMFDPNGEPLNVSPADVDRYEALGATLP